VVVKTKIAAVVFIIAVMGMNCVLAKDIPSERFAYCPSPETLKFDRSVNPEMIGFYRTTEPWLKVGPGARFIERTACLAILSIKENTAKIVYCMENIDNPPPNCKSQCMELEAGLSNEKLKFSYKCNVDSWNMLLEFKKNSSIEGSFMTSQDVQHKFVSKWKKVE